MNGGDGGIHSVDMQPCGCLILNYLILKSKERLKYIKKQSAGVTCFRTL